MTMGEWRIQYYVDDGGGMPAREFLLNLDPKTYTRYQWSMEQLKVRNIHARQPLVRHVDGKIWELREESGTNIYRLLYVFASDRRIILLHGFQKKSDKLPRRELETAHQRLTRFLAREGGEK